MTLLQHRHEAFNVASQLDEIRACLAEFVSKQGVVLLLSFQTHPRQLLAAERLLQLELHILKTGVKELLLGPAPIDGEEVDVGIEGRGVRRVAQARIHFFPRPARSQQVARHAGAQILPRRKIVVGHASDAGARDNTVQDLERLPVSESEDRI